MPLYNRAYKVANGVVYDSDVAEVLHHRDNFLSRKVLAVMPDGHYFCAIWGGLALGWVVFPIHNRLWAIREAIELKAPDSVLEKLGVSILMEVESDEPYNLLSAEFVWGERMFRFRWMYDFLAQNYDGRFFLFRNFEIGDVRIKKWVKPMSQRQALKWAVWYLPRDLPEKFKMLGVDISDLY